MKTMVLAFIICVFLSLLGGAVVWIFDPALGYIESSKIDLHDPANWRVVDKYSEAQGTLKKTPVDISVIFPAYNEEVRLPITLTKAASFLSEWGAKRNITYEIIIVDDGSTDNTQQEVWKWFRQDPQHFRLISLRKNQGKGGAVKVGIQEALGQSILMADADGATEIEDLDTLYSELDKITSSKGSQDLGIVIGSRAHLAKKSIASREFYRTILMKGFHFLVTLLCTQNIQDTQCGFKLFTQRVAKLLFSNLHLYRWAFDIEVIYQAEALGIPMKEVSVNWKEVEGSKLIRTKLDVVTTSLTMARDMLCVRLSYLLGIWRLPTVSAKYSSDEL